MNEKADTSDSDSVSGMGLGMGHGMGLALAGVRINCLSLCPSVLFDLSVTMLPKRLPFTLADFVSNLDNICTSFTLNFNSRD